MLTGALFAAVGCGEPDGRVRIQGVVTYDGGKPVPAGDIRFEPDVKAGGSGPVGFATITDGKYATSDNGKGAALGPMKIYITGYSAHSPAASLLFPRYETEANITEETRTLDFEVPKKK